MIYQFRVRVRVKNRVNKFLRLSRGRREELSERGNVHENIIHRSDDAVN